MHHSVALLAALLALCVFLGVAPDGAAAAELKVGDPAPPFSLPGTDGKTYSLSDFLGKQGVVLAWFPKAKTKGCTAECKSLRESGPALQALHTAYFTISVDSPELNQEFADELKLDYPILSDPSKSVAEEYGVLNERGVANRWTFYIDKTGIIRAIEKNINTARAGDDMAEKVKQLGLNATE